MRHASRAIVRAVALLIAALLFVVHIWLQSDTRMGLGQEPTFVEQVATVGLWLYAAAVILAVALLAWRRLRRPPGG